MLWAYIERLRGLWVIYRLNRSLPQRPRPLKGITRLDEMVARDRRKAQEQAGLGAEGSV